MAGKNSIGTPKIIFGVVVDYPIISFSNTALKYHTLLLYSYLSSNFPIAIVLAPNLFSSSEQKALTLFHIASDPTYFMLGGGSYYQFSNQ